MTRRAAKLAIRLALVAGFASTSTLVPPDPASAAEGWAAIAVDLAKPDREGTNREPAHAIGAGATEAEASEAAQARCREGGGRSCAAIVIFRGCAAYAASRSDAAWSRATTRPKAEELSLVDCKGGCKVIVSGCT